MQLIRQRLQHRELLRGSFPGGGQVETNPLEALILEIKHLGSAVGKVDNPARDDWSSIIDPDVDHSSVMQVGDAYPGSEG